MSDLKNKMSRDLAGQIITMVMKDTDRGTLMERLKSRFPEVSSEDLEQLIKAVDNQAKLENVAKTNKIFPARDNIEMQIEIFSALRLATNEKDISNVIIHFSETEKWLSSLEMQRFATFVTENKSLIEKLERRYQKLAKKNVDRRKIFEILCDEEEFRDQSPEKIKYIIIFFSR